MRLNINEFKQKLKDLKNKDLKNNIAIVNFRLYNKLKKLTNTPQIQPLFIEGFTFYINPNNLDNKVYIAKINEVDFEDTEIIDDSKPHQPKLPYFEEEENENIN